LAETRADIPPEFCERYLLAAFASGGVIVDLATGNYFRVNRTAATICETLRSTGDVGEAEARVSRELRISADEARKAMGEVIALLAAPAVHGEIQGSYHFYPANGGYGLWHGERCVLQVDSGAQTIRLATGAATAAESQIELYLRALAPKLLFQRGVTVLHASACAAAGKLFAFAGVSGAGKTTTVRAFCDAGARVLSEDLVILAPLSEQAQVLVGGEPFVQRWAHETASRLMHEPVKSVPSGGIVRVVDGPTAQLNRILVLDRTRRAGDDLATRPLAEPDAVLALMTHDFLGAIETETWRRFFEKAVALVGIVEVREASAPNGVHRLRQAAARYISRTAS